MIWFFERRGTHLRCEVLQSIVSDIFELVVTKPDGTECVESFTTSRDLNRRTRQLEDEWRRDGWEGPYMRFL
jgi:hypothetical protein